jgi:RNA recognition motif-containing protein
MNTKLFVGGLPFKTTQDELQQHFSPLAKLFLLKSSPTNSLADQKALDSSK